MAVQIDTTLWMVAKRIARSLSVKLAHTILACFLLWAHPARAQEIRTDYVFLIDVSGSMSGKGGATNIFPSVKAAVSGFLGSLPVGSDVYIVTFEGRIRDAQRFSLNDASAVGRARSYVQALQADGSSTAVFNSLNQVLEEARGRAAADSTRSTMFYVFTDGEDNVSHEWTLASILRRFNLRRGSNDWLFYTELGLPPNSAKKAEFNKWSHVVYGNESRGQVHAISQVLPVLTHLNFGNLKQSPSSSRLEQFRVLGAIADSVRISAEVQVERLASQGVLATIEPATLSPRDTVGLRLSLRNSQSIAAGSYRGTIRLRANDPFVRILPDSIVADLIYDDPAIITVAAAGGTGNELGILPSRRADAVTRSRDVAFSYNAAAKRAGIPLKATFGQDKAARSQTGLRFKIARASANENEVIVHGDTAITLDAAVTPDLPPGTYDGQLLLEAEGAEIKGDGLRTLDNGTTAGRWSVSVSKPPMPRWILATTALLILVAIALVVHRLTRPPRFTDLRLEVLQPTRRSVDLAGRTSIRLGRDGDDLVDTAARFAVVARKRGRTPVAELRVDDGTVYLKKAGARNESPILGQEDVHDGDTLRFGETTARVASYSIVRE